MENIVEKDGITIDLDNFESVFDAISFVEYKKCEKLHSLCSVLDFPIIDMDDDFKVKDLKEETLSLKSGEFKYLKVSGYSISKNRVLKIVRNNDFIRYINVNVIDDVESDSKEMYCFDLSNADSINWLQMYIEILYEIKNY
jgi:hypothetical protein